MKTNGQLAADHESHIAKELSFDNSRRSPSSGAKKHDPIDVTSDHLVIECEFTHKKSYSFSKDLWVEARMKAFNSKRPVIAFQFKDPNPRHQYDLVVLELDFFKELLETWMQKN